VIVLFGSDNDIGLGANIPESTFIINLSGQENLIINGSARKISAIFDIYSFL
jgi:hypothetical protein